jgi:glycyl-tRNA synthetase beta chain
LENKLRLGLRAVFVQAYGNYKLGNAPEPVIGLLMDFFADRLKVALKESGFRNDLISAIFALNEDDLLRLLDYRLQPLIEFVESPDGANLIAAYKRARNIVNIEEKKDGKPYKGDILTLDDMSQAEVDLQLALTTVGRQAVLAIEAENYKLAMKHLADLRPPIDAFFEQVLVNDKDPAKRANRLNMLASIRDKMNEVADFSKIEG